MSGGRGRPGKVRIIGGRWRGRKLAVENAAGLRPTPDRVRETLFNWLAPVIDGARCLDCFAGSGALGFEALSRGAASVVMIEKDRVLASALERHAAMLDASGAHILRADALTWLAANTRLFDVIFLDPPFGTDLAGRACAQILNKGHLAPGGVTYVETARGWEPPPGFTIRKQGKAGQVQYVLLGQRGAGGPEHQ